MKYTSEELNAIKKIAFEVQNKSIVGTPFIDHSGRAVRSVNIVRGLLSDYIEITYEKVSKGDKSFTHRIYDKDLEYLEVNIFNNWRN
jgi:hypothetical protein